MKNLKIKCAFLVFYILLNNVLFAQLKVGDNPTVISSSAQLQVDASNKGILIPRVLLLDKNDAITIPNPENSLIVFNIGGGTSTLSSGLYINYGTAAAPLWITFKKLEDRWELYNTYDITAANPIDRNLNGTGFNNLDLNMSITVVIPPFSLGKINVSYSTPVGIFNDAGTASGYYGVRFLKNGSELPTGSRKYTVASTASYARMVTVGATIREDVTNNTASPLNITYSLNGYLESVSSAGTIRYHMWDGNTNNNNFNWGRGTMVADVFTKPL